MWSAFRDNVFGGRRQLSSHGVNENEIRRVWRIFRTVSINEEVWNKVLPCQLHGLEKLVKS
jgi:hypothetical protein